MKPFIKPTAEQLKAYASEIGFREFDAERFFDHYEMIGWVTGKNKIPMRDWKAAVRLWKRNSAEWFSAGKPATRPAPSREVLEYAKIGRMIIDDRQGYEIGRFYSKVCDSIGPDGLDQVKAIIHDRTVKL